MDAGNQQFSCDAIEQRYSVPVAELISSVNLVLGEGEEEALETGSYAWLVGSLYLYEHKLVEARPDTLD